MLCLTSNLVVVLFVAHRGIWPKQVSYQYLMNFQHFEIKPSKISKITSVPINYLKINGQVEEEDLICSHREGKVEN